VYLDAERWRYSFLWLVAAEFLECLLEGCRIGLPQSGDAAAGMFGISGLYLTTFGGEAS
jgi:hypothetical protein